jgi:hypothetical protein
MNKIIFLVFIIVFLTKTGNVFSSNSIFNVDNIIINNDNNQSREKILNRAFNTGFKKLVKKILQNKDAEVFLSLDLSKIKELVQSYQIIENKDKKKSNQITINLTFNRKKINELLYLKNISYADISKISIVLFPVLVENSKYYLFSENQFYNNWNNFEKVDDNEFIDYILPAENIDDIQLIYQNKDKLESFDVKKILSNYNINNYIFLLIKPSENNLNIFLKGSIVGNKIIKNLKIVKSSDENYYKNSIKKIKMEINEIWKSQNLIDIRTPSFLNISLKLKNKRDLLNIQKTLNKIDLIENYHVIELNNNYAKIKIKYVGQIDKIKKKFKEQGIDVSVKDNNWVLKLI